MTGECAHRHHGVQERWRLRLEDAEAAAQAKLDRARDLISQYEDTITELSQDSSSLTASAQALRDDNSVLSAGLESARAEAEHLQAPALILCPPSSARLVQDFSCQCHLADPCSAWAVCASFL